MTDRPRLVRSVPYWVLVAGSLVAGGVGLWLTLDKLGVMTETLADGSATGVEVYAGQAWAVLGSILIGAGLVGLALALTLAAAASLVKRDEPVVVLADPFDDTDDDLAVDRRDDVDPLAGTVVIDDAPSDATASAALDAETDAPGSPGKS